MPLYEEKLISPFAIRFAQEHIRTTFKDGRNVEDAIAEMESQPGVGEYDLIVNAPFPHIEIAQWHPPGPERDGDHWFTLDNRRLYCLQRAAASHWPKTVGVVVHTLYSDLGAVWKKYDSSTYGRSVSIAHHSKSAERRRWDWYQEFLACDSKAKMFTTAKLVLSDDNTSEISNLLDAMSVTRSLAVSSYPLEEETDKLVASEMEVMVDSEKQASVESVSVPRSLDENSILSELARRFGTKQSRPNGDADANRSRTPSTSDDSDGDDTDNSSLISASMYHPCKRAFDEMVLHGGSGFYGGYGCCGFYGASHLMALQMQQATAYAHAAHAVRASMIAESFDMTDIAMTNMALKKQNMELKAQQSKLARKSAQGHSVRQRTPHVKGRGK